MKATDLTDREIFAAVFGAAFAEGGSVGIAEQDASEAVEAVRARRPKLATVGEWRPTGEVTLRRFYEDGGEQAALVIGEKWFVYGDRCDTAGTGRATSIDEAKAMCDAVLAVLEARR